MVQQEIRSEESHRSARSVQMDQQGSWTRWNLPERKLTQHERWQQEPLQLSFRLRSVCSMLPTPTPKEFEASQRTKLSTVQAEGNTHTCSNSLSYRLLFHGRYRWRYDQVLCVLADSLEYVSCLENRSTTRGKTLGHDGGPTTAVGLPRRRTDKPAPRYSHLVYSLKVMMLIELTDPC